MGRRFGRQTDTQKLICSNITQITYPTKILSPEVTNVYIL